MLVNRWTARKYATQGPKKSEAKILKTLDFSKAFLCGHIEREVWH